MIMRISIKAKDSKNPFTLNKKVIFDITNVLVWIAFLLLSVSD